MSQLYARIFLSILDSSIAEDWQVRHVFEDMLKLADDGVLDMTRQAFSRRTNIPLEAVNDAIKVLEASDPASRDPEEAGRRIARLDDNRDWGWRVVNWQKYEGIKKAADQRQKTRDRVRRHREGQNQVSPTSPSSPEASPASEAEHPLPNRYTALQSVTQANHKGRFAPAALKEVKLEAAQGRLPPVLDTERFKAAWADWEVHRREIGKSLKRKAREKQIQRLAEMGEGRAVAALEHSISQGWQGIFEPNGQTRPQAVSASKPDHAKGF